MKRFMLSLFAAFFLLMPVDTVQAGLISYKFEGYVRVITDRDVGDDNSPIARSGLKEGDAVDYTFLIDFDRDGTETMYDGDVEIRQDGGNYDFFYTDYISGSALPDAIEGYESIATSVSTREYNFGADNHKTVTYRGTSSIHGNSTFNHL